jgi:hypothetical protein
MTALVLMLLSAHGLAQERPGATSLELKLEVGKSTLVLGEPVYATVRLSNVGAAPVEVAKLLDPQTGDVHIEVASSSRPRFVYLPLFFSDTVQARTSLAQGEEIAAAFPIFYGALGWTFHRPETYGIIAGYRSSRGAHQVRVQSNPVSVTVVDEGGPGSLLMNGTSVGEEAGKFLLWQHGDHLEAGQALLTDLLKTFPGSPVADYTLLAFGRNLSRSFRNYAVGRIRPPDCEAALAYFRKVRSERLPVLLQVQQYLDEARCLARLSKPAQAGEALKRAEQLGGDRPEFRLLFEQAIRLEPALKQTP